MNILRNELQNWQDTSMHDALQQKWLSDLPRWGGKQNVVCLWKAQTQFFLCLSFD